MNSNRKSDSCSLCYAIVRMVAYLILNRYNYSKLRGHALLSVHVRTALLTPIKDCSLHYYSPLKDTAKPQFNSSVFSVQHSFYGAIIVDEFFLVEFCKRISEDEPSNCEKSFSSYLF